jgi:hypothetical protein
MHNLGVDPPTDVLLPMLKTGSIDLITAAMVFHHVMHVNAAILGDRRILSDVTKI